MINNGESFLRAVYGKAKVNENIIYAEVKLFSSKETAANFRPES